MKQYDGRLYTQVELDEAVTKAEREARLKELVLYEKQLSNGNFILQDAIESMRTDIAQLKENSEAA